MRTSSMAVVPCARRKSETRQPGRDRTEIQPTWRLLARECCRFGGRPCRASFDASCLTFAFSGRRAGATMWDTHPPSVEPIK